MAETKIISPKEIEKRSFEIISERLKGDIYGDLRDDILKRVIHTSADFDYRENLCFSPGAADIGLEAIKKGAIIVTDTQMAYSGINKRTLEKFGGRAVCFMSDEDVAAEAKERGVTRAIVSMERACSIEGRVIFAIGNAPTALIAIDELIKKGAIRPELIIGVPVGFVNVVESKELILRGETPCIVARGNKGGSNIAAAICNAFIYRARDEEGL